MLRAMDSAAIIDALRRLGVPHERIAKVLGRDRTAATKMLANKRTVKATEIEGLVALIAEFERASDQPPQDPTQAYVTVEVLPTFAGMGGGGSGDGDLRVAMLPRQLVEDELRARATDLLMIDLRGNSMEPLFFHGDQVLIDKRDTNPVQPGPFALWDGDGYVVKNVERQSGRYRIFSNNTIYSDRIANPEDVRIMGRPVWYARKL